MADLTGSDVPSTGLIRDLSVSAGGYDSANLAYRLDAPNPEAMAVGVYVDGDLVGRQSHTEVVGSVAALSQGDHTLNLLPLPIGQPLYSRHGNDNGNRVHLRWPASTSADCASYKVYRDAQLIATVTDRIVEPVEYHRTSTGGRISIFGRPSALETVNASMPVTIVSPGILSFDGVEYEYQPGVTISLPYGIKITFHDAADLYSDFSVFVGIKHEYTTDPLEPGIYYFEVRAYDAAGNDSAALSRTIRVHAVPPEVTVTDNVITGDASLMDEVRIYSDFNRASGEIGPHIEERFPVEILTSMSDNIFGEPDLPVGARYYARPFKGGIERDDLIIHTVTDPEAPIIVWGAIGDLSLQPAPAGDMVFVFHYRPEEDDSATGFQVTYGVVGSLVSTTISAPLSGGSGFPVMRFPISLPTAATTDTEIFAYVHPVAGLTLGSVSETVTGVADATPPSFSGTLGGVAT